MIRIQQRRSEPLHHCINVAATSLGAEWNMILVFSVFLVSNDRQVAEPGSHIYLDEGLHVPMFTGSVGLYWTSYFFDDASTHALLHGMLHGLAGSLEWW